MSAGGIILAAPASGSGKTTLTLGLVRHLADAGRRVAAAKSGPDYIDAGLHAAAGAIIARNLDAWAMRPATLAALVDALQQAGDIVVCEGAMGLFDGAGALGEEGSTAALAALTGWPVVLVIDARGQSASAAALLRGFAAHRADVAIAGVILNRVGSARHAAVIATALARHCPEIPVLGAVPRQDGLMLAERHLGLVPAGEQARWSSVVEAAAEAVAAHLDVARLVGLARPSRLSAAESAPPLPPLGQRIAVARDDAFLFAYPAILEGWRRAGAELSFFAPLADEPPSSDADAVFLPGGYPELHAEPLAAAARFRAGLAEAAARGVVYGECGGYMALGRALIGADGKAHAMAGLLPLVTSFAERRLHLGYRTARRAGDGALSGTFRGHEFHYASIVEEAGAEPLFAVTDAAGEPRGTAGLVTGRVMGSFLHLVDRA